MVTKITAQSKEFPFSNSMSEFTHRVYKSEFMQGRISQTKVAHFQNLEIFKMEYNHQRYMGNHFGYTPMEVLNGKIPDKNRFKKQILKERALRIEYNQKFKLCFPKVGCK